jgi:hypothetical protein
MPIHWRWDRWVLLNPRTSLFQNQRTLIGGDPQREIHIPFARLALGKNALAGF